ncbi:major royal jelly family protein [Acuticoccus sediminis]|uniref:major royal jelly family protein n=1 Tax=Acuticoccus sediminis TaxID=2184697 RepID=UPI001CFD905B|nr:major royal jelly family protein [Acuticoccus sediminis]
MRRAVAAATLAASLGAAPSGAMADGAMTRGLEVALTLPDVASTGIATTPGGRLFVLIARIDGSPGPRVVEWRDDGPTPYPDATINDWHVGADPRTMLVRVNSMRIGPDGDLWLVDTGSPAIGEPVLPGGAKLVVVDLADNRVRRTIPLDGVIGPTGFVDDIRFNGGTAYLTDAGNPGLIVLDIASGAGRRVLDGDPSVTADRPISAEGRIVHGPDGAPVYVHADQLEVSPDGAWLYFQPVTGPLRRVPTALLDDPDAAASLADHVEIVADLPPTGGTAIAADGAIYASDVQSRRIMRVAPDGTVSTLIEDPRLLWVDAMWIDAAGYLWMPAAQLDRAAIFQGGTSAVRFPTEVFRLPIGTGPAPNDHD